MEKENTVYEQMGDDKLIKIAEEDQETTIAEEYKWGSLNPKQDLKANPQRVGSKQEDLQVLIQNVEI